MTVYNICLLSDVNVAIADPTVRNRAARYYLELQTALRLDARSRHFHFIDAAALGYNAATLHHLGESH